jgi:hypothetical protein
MRKALVTILAVAAALVALFGLTLRAGVCPLGVRGEWEWLRLPIGPTAIQAVLAASAVAAYAVFAGLVCSVLKTRATAVREALAVAALLVASVAVQAAAQSGAPVGYGLAKWVVALHQKGSSGYFTVAKTQVRDPWRFLADYPEWIRHQDALHIGTHPPGLVVLESALLRAMEQSPRSARFVEDHVPDSVAIAFRLFGHDNPMSPADRATLALTGFLTLLACGATVVPLYALARAGLPALSAWPTAALWPLVPSAILFQPAADTAFPLLSTTALALAAHAGGRGPALLRRPAAVLAGVVLGLGMQFTLAFLPVGLIVAAVLMADREVPWRDRVISFLATGVGFLGLTALVWAATGANPFAVWWWNQRNHARFYVEYPRSYRAWVVANPVELLVALGLPASVWMIAASAWPREVPRVSVATAAVLAFLTLSGRNLSEVARLWIPFMPALLVAAGFAMGRLGAGPRSLAATIGLVGAQTLVLEATIQVVYPV